ncbi:MYND finger domain-containing protein [Hirsutella rhossiliensis]|uniref:MYND finger domain-containing protein n=1 Tax=Hirsutella rhossiliensis TaxID=111463 RepID=A0A9P8MLD8_9HYPO|nr:MYND finger domain-containing protein [Hirsutella rhossiliensis]KAH0957467.1 MYND finger domain-containing protein [Hirsutella rhossiliensis]
MTPPPPPTLQIRSNESSSAKGRSLHATRPFRPGQTIHAFAAPRLALASTTHLARVCSHCLRPGDPRACSRCRAAFYCDPACQAAAWAAVHARECKALRRRRQGSDRPAALLPTPVRALVQALLVDETARALAPLEGHVPRRRNQGRGHLGLDGGGGWQDLQMMAMAGCAFAGMEGTEDEVTRAVDLLCKIQTNAFHRYDADLGQVGIFLEPTLAMANHSCVPNALVQFIGRKGILTAERPIEAGDEVEISYTDYTYPLTKRQQALASYCFECRCPRCKDDLNVYQVGAASPRNIIPDGLSLVPDPFSRLRNHPAVNDAGKQVLVKAHGESATMSTERRTMPQDSLHERHEMLLAQYRDCAGLVAAEMWAVTPVPQLLTEISIYYAERGDFAFALAVACFVATACDPYRYAAYFHPVRAKNVLMIAKLLANTAEGTTALNQAVESITTRADLDQKIRETLRDIDQVSLCQMLLIMVLRSAPAGHADGWEVAVAAREMLQDIEQLPGRDKELPLITAWMQDPSDEQCRAFFDYAVVQQVDALASLGRAVLQVKFGTGA